MAATPLPAPHLAASREVGLRQVARRYGEVPGRVQADYLAAAGTSHFEACDRRFWPGWPVPDDRRILAAIAIGLGPRRVRSANLDGARDGPGGVRAFVRAGVTALSLALQRRLLLTGIRGAAAARTDCHRCRRHPRGIRAGGDSSSGPAPGRAHHRHCRGSRRQPRSVLRPVEYAIARGIPEFYDALRHAGENILRRSRASSWPQR